MLLLPLVVNCHSHPSARAGQPNKAMSTSPVNAPTGDRPRGLRPEAIQGAEALAPFFQNLEALAGGQDRVVRIFQFGDSHTAQGSWTDRMRQSFQARFGDGGPGLVLPGGPLRGFGHEGLAMTRDKAWPSRNLKVPENDLLVGLPGAATSLPNQESFRVSGRFQSFQIQSVGLPGDVPSVALACPEAGGGPGSHLPLRMARVLTPLANGQALSCVEPSPGSLQGPVELAIALPPTSSLLGVDLRTGRPGVIYDELGISGTWLLDLKRWSPQLRRALLHATKADLVILAYGTNEMGWDSYDLGTYEADATALLQTLRKETPGTAFLVVGPMDPGAATPQRRTVLTARGRRITAALRSAAFATGCAFWDSRQALGGTGSFDQLRARNLASSDLLHLTPAGYQLMGDLLYQALFSAFEHRSSYVAFQRQGDWWQGLFWWDWTIGKQYDTDYPPLGKPAADTLKTFYLA